MQSSECHPVPPSPQAMEAELYLGKASAVSEMHVEGKGTEPWKGRWEGSWRYTSHD